MEKIGVIGALALSGCSLSTKTAVDHKGRFWSYRQLEAAAILIEAESIADKTGSPLYIDLPRPDFLIVKDSLGDHAQRRILRGGWEGDGGSIRKAFSVQDSAKTQKTARVTVRFVSDLGSFSNTEVFFKPSSTEAGSWQYVESKPREYGVIDQPRQ